VRTLYVRPVGSVSPAVTDAIAGLVQEEYQVDAVVLPEVPVPDDSFDAGRKQYSSSAIMQMLVAQCPEDALRLFGITECDLFIPMLSFVFGQAQLRGRVALLSIARLRQEFYGLPVGEELLMERIHKETLHELGHTFGLLHCLDKGCPMALSTTVQLLDAKSTDYCPSCSTLLRGALAPGRMENRR